MRTVFQIVQDFHKDARIQNLPIKWGPLRGDAGAFDLPEGVDPSAIKHVANTKFPPENVEIEQVKRAIQLLNEQCESAGPSFSPGTILAVVEGSMLEIHGGVPVEWLDAVEILTGADVEWIGLNAGKRLHVQMRTGAEKLIEKADAAAQHLDEGWTVEIVAEGQKFQQLSRAFLEESMQLIGEVEPAIHPFRVRAISADKLTLSGFSDFSLAGEALEAAAHTARLMRASAHPAHILEMLSDYGSAPQAAISPGSITLSEPFDEFEKMFRAEVAGE